MTIITWEYAISERWCFYRVFDIFSSHLIIFIIFLIDYIYARIWPFIRTTENQNNKEYPYKNRYYKKIVQQKIENQL